MKNIKMKERTNKGKLTGEKEQRDERRERKKEE